MTTLHVMLIWTSFEISEIYFYLHLQFLNDDSTDLQATIAMLGEHFDKVSVG